MKLKHWFSAARRRPFAALYLVGAVLLLLSMAGSLALDSLLYALGVYEQKTVTLSLKKDQLRYYHRDMSFKADSGEFLIQIGHDSENGLSQKIFIEV